VSSVGSYLKYKAKMKKCFNLFQQKLKKEGENIKNKFSVVIYDLNKISWYQKQYLK
jgi:hypothetical protein